MRALITSCLLVFGFCLVYGQSSNYRAQGYYYKAKELYEAFNYDESLDYIDKAKSSLNGTNYKLQYLHIMTLVKKKDWIGADREMQRYFNVIDRVEQPKGFTKEVEKLTLDETKELTKLMVDIEENAEKARNQPKQKTPPTDNSERLKELFKKIIRTEYRATRKDSWDNKYDDLQEVSFYGTKVKILSRTTITRPRDQYTGCESKEIKETIFEFDLKEVNKIIVGPNNMVKGNPIEHNISFKDNYEDGVESEFNQQIYSKECRYESGSEKSSKVLQWGVSENLLRGRKLYFYSNNLSYIDEFNSIVK